MKAKEHYEFLKDIVKTFQEEFNEEETRERFSKNLLDKVDSVQKILQELMIFDESLLNLMEEKASMKRTGAAVPGGRFIPRNEAINKTDRFNSTFSTAFPEIDFIEYDLGKLTVLGLFRTKGSPANIKRAATIRAYPGLDINSGKLILRMIFAAADGRHTTVNNNIITDDRMDESFMGPGLGNLDLPSLGTMGGSRRFADVLDDGEPCDNCARLRPQ